MVNVNPLSNVADLNLALASDLNFGSDFVGIFESRFAAK